MTTQPEATTTPHPGSDEALEQGCRCPVLDNSYGKGRYGDGAKFGWWMTEGCPLHSPSKEQPQ